MGIAKLIVLGAGLGVGVVGLDRTLEGWQGPAALTEPVVSGSQAEPVTQLVSLPAPGSPLPTPSTPRVSRVGPVPSSAFKDFGGAMPPINLERLEHRAGQPALDAAKRYAVARADSGYRVVEFRCVGQPLTDEAISAKLREALEAAEARRGL